MEIWEDSVGPLFEPQFLFCFFHLQEKDRGKVENFNPQILYS